MTRTTTPPQHGERRCYLRGCRRDECVDANKRYCKRYKHRQLQQGHVHVNANEAREHIVKLLSLGSSRLGIAAAAGINATIVQEIVSRPNKKIRPETARRILAVRFEPAAAPLGHWTDPVGTVRRIQALTVLGYPLYETAKALKVSYSAVRFIGRETRRSVSKDFAARTAALYADWSRRPGPSSHARGQALARGWHGPAAWDDIDDPLEIPDVEAGEASENRLELAAYRREEILHLASFGIPEHDIAERLGMSADYVTTKLRELRTAA